MDENLIMHGFTDDRQKSKIEVKHFDDMREGHCISVSPTVGVLVVKDSSGVKHATFSY